MSASLTRQMDLFSTLPASAEGADLEFKSARGGLPDSFWETYSAMANTQGGTIVLGVADKPDGLVWEGVPDPAQLRTVLWNQLNNRQKISANLLASEDIETIERSGRQFIVARIPRSTRAQRPVYVGLNPLTGTFRRAEDGDYHCTEDEVRRMLADQSGTPADTLIVEHFGIRDLDIETIKQYRNRFSSRAPDHPWLSEDDAGLLFKLGAISRDRSSGTEGVTVAGLLMFGTFVALREALPAYHVDYRERLSSDPAIRWTDRIVPDGSWESNVFQFYQRVAQRLALDMKIPFQLNRELYRKDDTIVHEALREALVNALIHADYRGQGGVVIERHPDRIELSNPGSLLVSREQLLKGGVSECRNKSLQLMFQMIGGGERAGSGLDKIRSGWRSQHWRSPKIEESFQPDRIKLVLPMVSLIPIEAEQALLARFGVRFSRLDPVAVQAMVTAQVEGVVTNGRLQEVTGEHATDITTVLQTLVRDGLLTQQNQKRWASYRVVGDSPQSASESSQGFPRLDGNSPHSERDSPHLPSDLVAIAAPARTSRKLPADKMRQLIVSLCADRWLTARELGELLSRDADNLQSRILTAMVRDRRLELRFPEIPNRPDQAYRAVSNPE